MQSTSIAEAKAALRQQVRTRLAEKTKRELLLEDARLFAEFITLPEVHQAQTLFLFYGTQTEPETSILIRSLLEVGKTIALPRMLPGHQMEVLVHDPARPLVQNRFGIWEPDTACPALSPNEIDLVLVPALCYDKHNYRLGMGGGYYDRWLEHYHGLTVGLCRPWLLMDKLPVAPHDRPVDLVITGGK